MRNNVAVAINLGRSGASTGSFVRQSGDEVERGVMVDGRWEVTREPTPDEDRGA